MTDRPPAHGAGPSPRPTSPTWSPRANLVSRSSARVRRRRSAFFALAMATLIVVLLVVNGGSGPSKNKRPGTTATTSATSSAQQNPAVEAGVLPWSLSQPLSREVVLPGPGSSITVIGGLSASQSSLATIFSLNTSNGSSTPAGQLSEPVHDAAGAQVGAQDLLLGGGSPTTIADVEAFSSPTTANAATGSVVGHLPQPRSDASAVTIGGMAYVLGGYDGTAPDPQVLATTDGQHFSLVASLPVPVRYAAVVAFKNKIYLFGGEAISGASSGQPVDTIQVVDTAAHTAKVIGRLPKPLAGAAAAVITGRLYLAGGVTPAGSGTFDSASVFAYDIASGRTMAAGTLPVAVAYGAATVVGNRAWLVGGEVKGTPVASVEMFTPNTAFGTAGTPGAGSPFFGDKLLIADRGNNRLLVLDDTNQILWTYPSIYAAAPPGGFYFPDDAFFAKGGTEIISNQEQNDTIVIIAYPSGQVLWQYGHPRQAGTAPGYLHEPDDAYLLKNGQVTVADAQACRVLFINPDKTIAKQIGTSNVCRHSPPNYVGSPNGDTPLANGDVLVSEINGQWVSEYTPAGALVWTVHLPITYPSDPQQLGPDLYLLSDYTNPGAIVEFNREGQILYQLRPTSGAVRLDKPSLTELLPSGVFMTNDDYRHRMVAIDPTTGALVWQYGVTDTPGTGPGMLNTPDGFDLLLPDGSTPTHLATG